MLSLVFVCPVASKELKDTNKHTERITLQSIDDISSLRALYTSQCCRSKLASQSVVQNLPIFDLNR